MSEIIAGGDYGRLNDKVSTSLNHHVLIYNSYPIGTGIGEYVSDLINVDVNMKCINFIFNKQLRSEVFLGMKQTSPFPGIPKLEFLVNSNFQYFFHRNLKKRLSRQDKEDLIVHYADPSITPFGLGVPETVTIHDVLAYYPKLSGGSAFNLKYRHVVTNFKKFKGFESVITISNKVKNELLALGWDNKITVIPYAVGPEFVHLDDKIRARKHLNLPLDKTLVLSVSNDAPRKNLLTVSKTLNLLGNNFRLVRVGQPLGNSINFENVNDRKVMNIIYNACDVLLFPTLDEGFGRPVVEALSAGLPVVVSDSSIMREISGDSAIFVKPKPSECAIGVREALQRAESLITRGIEQSKNFSFEIFKKRMIAFYSSLV